MSKIQCLTCGGMTELGDALQGSCEYCGCPVEFKRAASFNGIDKEDLGRLRGAFEAAGDGGVQAVSAEKNSLAQALCYLLAGNFILAKKKLSAIIDKDPESAEPYYYYALSLVNGRTLTEISIKEARTITEYLQTAIAMDDTFIFPKIFYALLCIEYYEANDLRAPADGRAIFGGLAGCNADPGEMELFRCAVKTDLL